MTPVIVGFIVLSLFASYSVWRIMSTNQPRHASETYIKALATGDAVTASGISSGNAAVIAAKLKKNNITAKVESIDTSVAAIGKGWARVLATVDLTLQDSSVDAGWYTLDLVKTDQGWKVITFAESDSSDISGVRIFGGDLEEPRKVFEAYLDTLANNRWQEGARLLVGPARRSMEMSSDILGKAPFIGKAEYLQLKPLWSHDKTLVSSFSYRLNNRDVSVTVEFYKTSQGWKIRKIEQC